MQRHKVNVWLVNTGWSGGSYGTGSRIELRYTRAIIDAIHNGTLASAPTQTDPMFGFAVVKECPEVPSDCLLPENTWADKEAFHATAQKLADLFTTNFKKFSDGVTADIASGGPPHS
jgi:phosphoenolpyruvate carboxykinase (ATP)